MSVFGTGWQAQTFYAMHDKTARTKGKGLAVASP
jgi:hypothetical protein